MDREGGRGTRAATQGLSAMQTERFERAVLPYLDAAYDLARHLLRDPDRAADAVQEAFLRALRHFDGFRGVDGRAWLLTIVRNSCWSLLRGERRDRLSGPFDEELHSPDDRAHGPEADRERAAAGATVQEALGRLPAEFREVLVLRELEGLSYREIAEVTAVPVGTVMSRLSRARQRMARLLEPRPEEAGHDDVR